MLCEVMSVRWLLCLFMLMPVGAAPQAAAPRMAEQWLTDVLDAMDNPQTFSDDPWPILRPLGVTSVTQSSCWRAFSLAKPHPAFLVGVYGFTLGPAGDCEHQHLGVINLIVKGNKLPASRLAQRVTERLGITPTHAVEGPNDRLHWQRSLRDAVEVAVSSDPRDAGTVAITIVRAQQPDSNLR